MIDNVLKLSKYFKIFPLQVNCKIPLKYSHGHKDATDNEIILKEWWKYDNYNIGVATGEINNITVIDIDIKNNKNGLDNWRKINTQLIRTFTVVTPSNGLHLYFKYNPNIKTSAGVVADGIDIRNDGGFVVGPYSSINRRFYSIINPMSFSEFPEYPELIDRQKTYAVKTNCKKYSEPISYYELESYLNNIDATDYQNWIECGMALKTWHEQKGLQMWLKWSSKDPRYNEYKSINKWNSFHIGGITIATIIAKSRR